MQAYISKVSAAAQAVGQAAAVGHAITHCSATTQSVAIHYARLLSLCAMPFVHKIVSDSPLCIREHAQMAHYWDVSRLKTVCEQYLLGADSAP